MSAESQRVLLQLSHAVDRLREVLAEPIARPLVVDAAIQRFEFTIELFWKAMKRMLDEEGIETRTPREALQRAYQVGWLDDETTWLQLLRDRNQTSHAYDELLAREILERVRLAFPEMERTLDRLRQRNP